MKSTLAKLLSLTGIVLAIAGIEAIPAQAIALVFDTEAECEQFRADHRDTYPDGWCKHHAWPDSAYYPKWQFNPH